MYLIATRANIMQAIRLISIFIQSPSKIHFGEAKRIFRYVLGTSDFGTCYTSTYSFGLVGYIDSDWAGCIDDRKNTSGYVFILGLGVVSWSSNKQPTVSLSSTKA